MTERYSRRDLFTKILKGAGKQTESSDSNGKDRTETLLEAELTRRDALRVAGISVLALLLNHYLGDTADASDENLQKKSEGELGDSKNGKGDDKPESFLESHATTIRDLFIFNGAKIAFLISASALKIPVGSAPASEESIIQIKKDLKNALLEGALYTPVAEETVFRVLPYMSTKLVNRELEVAIVSSAIYAAMHNIYFDSSDDVKFARKIPVHHFAFGLFCWYLMRERGLSHPYVAHAVNNAAALSALHFIWRKFPSVYDRSISRARELSS